MSSEAVIGLANNEMVSLEHSSGAVRISARYLGAIACRDCSSEDLRRQRALSANPAARKLGNAPCFPDPRGAQVALIVADRFHVIRL